MQRSLSGLLFFLILTFQLNAATVRINNSEEPVVQLNTPVPASFTLVVDSPSGDGTSESAPAKTYVPILNTAHATSNEDYNTYSSAAALPEGADASDSGLGTLKFYLDTASVSGTEYLHVAIKDSSSSVYKVLSSVAVTANESAKAYDLTISDMCSASAADLSCETIFEDDAPTSTVDALIYFFISGTQTADSDPIDPGTSTGGIYYKVYLSNKIYDSNTITMSNLTKGDSRLTAIFQGFSFTDLYRVMAIDFTAGCSTVPGTATGTRIETDLTTTSGEAIIKPLVNDTSYTFGIYFENKFKFGSQISNCIEGTPQAIEALLKKNSCFLLTAGFHGDHPVIDYFRNWRDEVLAQNYLGRKFIKFYYTWGPKMAPVVLSTPWLAKTVRGSAHVMYWVIEYSLWILMLVFAIGLSLGTFVLVLNRKKEEELFHGRSQ